MRYITNRFIHYQTNNMELTETITRANEFIELEDLYGAHNYHPIPVVLKKGRGVYLWDVDDKIYFDFLSGYSALNQGHCHPRIIKALIHQAQNLTLTSRAFHNNKLGEFEKFITQLFAYDKVLPMNTGAEAVETAIKLCRKWAYEVKGIAEGQAKIIMAEGNFHGRTTTIISGSSDPESKNGFGPYMPNIITIPYNNVSALQEALRDNNIAGFLVEPLQGEAGVIIPDEGYLSKCFELCKNNNVLFIADEVQTGIGRTGKMLACDHENVRPDILVLGKALGGGVLPISAVLCDDEIMLTIKPGQHGSTFGGNPLACAVAMEALSIIKDERLVDHSSYLGEYLLQQLSDIKSKWIKQVRGKGLFTAIEIKSKNRKSAWNICIALAENGLLAKPTHDFIIRLAPPLIITRAQIDECVEIIKNTIANYEE